MHWFKYPKCNSRNLTIRAYAWCHVDQSDVDGEYITKPSTTPGDWEIDPDWDNGEMCCEDCQNQESAHKFKTDEPPATTSIDEADISGPQINEPE
jgi:hypothetical protein